MYRQNCVLWCCMLLFVATSSDSQRNFKNDDEQNTDLTVQHDRDANFKKVKSNKDESIRYNSHENSTKNYDKVQFRINSTKDDHDNNDSIRNDFSAHTIKNDEENNQTDLGSKTSRKDENNTVSQEIYGNFSNTEDKNYYIIDDNDNSTFPNETCENNYIVDDNDNNTFSNETCKNNYTVNDSGNTTFSNETCKTNTCIQLCCPLGDRFIRGEKCVSKELSYSFPDVYTSNNLSQKENKSLDEIFDQLIVQNPCQKFKKGSFAVHRQEYKILTNGSLYLSSYDTCLSSKYYCLAVVSNDIYDVITCKWFDSNPMFLSMSLVVSLPFLLATFVVYSILPKLRNLHGYSLRSHVVSLFVSYTILPIFHQIRLLEMGYSVCISLAYILTFSFTASFLWLNVICFDIWWTFRGISSSQGYLKQREKKKLILYSIYAWGSALFLTIICAIVDNIPDAGKYLIQPIFCKGNSWFGDPTAKSLYFYLPVGITIIVNICFFVITALKIILHKRRTANQLRRSESRCHDDNKQRFMMYLKLFIVMGITWIMEIVSWFHTNEILSVIYYPSDMINALQGVIIFVIFVCNKKIIRQLLKRLGWQEWGLLGKISTSDERHSSTTTISETVMENIPSTQVN